MIHGDAMDVLQHVPVAGVGGLVTDPPYGIAYKSNRIGVLQRSVAGDESTQGRDFAIEWACGMPVLCFGTWKVPRPASTRQVLIWDKGGALGMGALDIPWKPDHEEIYVIGKGFTGSRDCGSVLRHPPVQSTARNGRVHPTEKPLSLMIDLMRKMPKECLIVDPFCGSGTTGVACLMLGRRFLGIECDEGYCCIAKRRLEQAVPLFSNVSSDVAKLWEDVQ